MKKSILFIFISAMSLAVGSAQADKRSLNTSEILMSRSDDSVTVTFTLETGKRVVRATEKLVVNPVLRGEDSERALPSILVRGRRSRVIDRRHELRGGVPVYEPVPTQVVAGESVEYTATLPYREWMIGGDLVFDGVRVDCCSARKVDFGVIAGNVGIVAGHVLFAEPVFDTKIVEVKTTTGSKLAEKYSFVAPVSELEKSDSANNNGPGNDNANSAGAGNRFTDYMREGSISVFFRQGVFSVDRSYMDNHRRLTELIAAVRNLVTAKDSRIVKIVIAGYTSPEGSTAVNTRLAADRATIIKRFLENSTDVDPKVVTILNGGADWVGLRALVNDSNMHGKQDVIDIIDNQPVWDARKKVGRLGELMRLDGGAPYKHMLNHMFPRLRQAAYIKVYYEDN